MNHTPLHLSFSNLNNYDNFMAVLNFELDTFVEVKEVIASWEKAFQKLAPKASKDMKPDNRTVVKICDLGVQVYKNYLDYPTIDEIINTPMDNTYLGGNFIINFLNRKLIYGELVILLKVINKKLFEENKDNLASLSTIKQTVILSLEHIKNEGSQTPLPELAVDLEIKLTNFLLEKGSKEAVGALVMELVPTTLLLLQAFRFFEVDTTTLVGALTPMGYRLIKHIEAYEEYRKRVLSAHEHLKNLEPPYNFL